MNSYVITVLAISASLHHARAQCPNLQACIAAETATCGPEPDEGSDEARQERWEKKRVLINCVRETLRDSGFNFEQYNNQSEANDGICSKRDAFESCGLKKPWHNRSSSSSSSEEKVENSSEDKPAPPKEIEILNPHNVFEEEEGEEVDKPHEGIIKTRGERIKRHHGGWHHDKEGRKHSDYRCFRGCKSLLYGAAGEDGEKIEPPTVGRRCYYHRMKECILEHKNEVEELAGCKFNEEPEACDPQVAAAIEICKGIAQTIE